MARPPADVPGPAMTLDDTTPMGSSTALTFIKPKRDRMKAHSAASVNKCSTNAPPDATPLAERINANRPHALAPLQSPLHVPGTYGHATHHAFHHGARGRNSILPAEDIRPGTPERTRLGNSFRSIERVRLDAANLQRARSPMLPPPVPAPATRQPRSADAIDSVINREAPHNVGPMTLTEDSCEQILPEREEQNDEQSESGSIIGERPPTIVSEAGDHEERVENSLTQVQSLQEALPILAAPQVATKQTALGEYLVSHAEESSQAEERWKGASVDEWKTGAQEMRDRLVKIIDFTKHHMKRKLDAYRSIQGSIEDHKERITKRQKLLDDKAKATTETTTRMLAQIGCRNSV